MGDLSGRILGEYRRRLEDGVDHHLALADARTMLDSVRVGSARLRAVGLGLPAPIAGDVVQSSAIFPGWEGVNAREVAEDVFDVPVHVENDANLGALAEHRIGAARGHDSSVYVKTSSGVGAGIIVDNELFQGAGGTAGEIGHLTIDENGPLCRCGKRGCLEAYTSTPFVTREVSGQVPGADDIDQVVAAAREGNVAARRALEEAGPHLGRGLASVVNLINPSIVVVGGHLAMAGDLLLDPRASRCAATPSTRSRRPPCCPARSRAAPAPSVPCCSPPSARTSSTEEIEMPPMSRADSLRLVTTHLHLLPPPVA